MWAGHGSGTDCILDIILNTLYYVNHILSCIDINGNTRNSPFSNSYVVINTSNRKILKNAFKLILMSLFSLYQI